MLNKGFGEIIAILLYRQNNINHFDDTWKMWGEISTNPFHSEIRLLVWSFKRSIRRRGSSQWIEYVRVWASYQIRKIASCACAGNAGNDFPRHWLQRKPLVNDPGMHHGTCVTHVPWCMSWSLTRGRGESVPDIPGVCATLNFTYLVRGPLRTNIMEEVWPRQGRKSITIPTRTYVYVCLCFTPS